MVLLKSQCLGATGGVAAELFDCKIQPEISVDLETLPNYTTGLGHQAPRSKWPK